MDWITADMNLTYGFRKTRTVGPPAALAAAARACELQHPLSLFGGRSSNHRPGAAFRVHLRARSVTKFDPPFIATQCVALFTTHWFVGSADAASHRRRRGTEAHGRGTVRGTQPLPAATSSYSAAAKQPAVA